MVTDTTKALRMKVFREGQLAFSSGATCPYTDWRVGTWNKGWNAAKEHAEELTRYDPTATVPCELCGTPTQMLGTKRCNGCWELETRIRRDPGLARQILESL